MKKINAGMMALALLTTVSAAAETRTEMANDKNFLTPVQVATETGDAPPPIPVLPGAMTPQEKQESYDALVDAIGKAEELKKKGKSLQSLAVMPEFTKKLDEDERVRYLIRVSEGLMQTVIGDNYLVRIYYLRSDDNYPDIHGSGKYGKEGGNSSPKVKRSELKSIRHNILLDYVGEGYEKYSPKLAFLTERVAVDFIIETPSVIQPLLSNPKISEIVHIGKPPIAETLFGL